MWMKEDGNTISPTPVHTGLRPASRIQGKGGLAQWCEGHPSLVVTHLTGTRKGKAVDLLGRKLEHARESGAGNVQARAVLRNRENSIWACNLPPALWLGKGVGTRPPLSPASRH